MSEVGQGSMALGKRWQGNQLVQMGDPSPAGTKERQYLELLKDILIGVPT